MKVSLVLSIILSALLEGSAFAVTEADATLRPDGAGMPEAQGYYSDDSEGAVVVYRNDNESEVVITYESEE